MGELFSERDREGLDMDIAVRMPFDTAPNAFGPR
jgi:hypothetical protein